MPIEIRMPALSPTMEEGKLARWLVKTGDRVASGDVLAEIETDKATMEFEAVDEGTIATIAVAEGTEKVRVGTVIATLSGDDEADGAGAAPARSEPVARAAPSSAPSPAPSPSPATPPATPPAAAAGPVREAAPRADRVAASPLARRLAAERGLDIAKIAGSGPHGRVVRADVEKADVETAGVGNAGAAPAKAAGAPPVPAAPAAPAPVPAAPSGVAMAEETRALLDARVPHTVEKLSGMRKTIARRLTQSMQQAPHIYLSVDVRLDRLLAMRAEMNAALAGRGIKLSVNDMLVKALGRALVDVPECNVTFAGNELIRYGRADISVAVSIPGGLITPIVQDASGRSLSEIAVAARDLATRAKEGRLKPEEYQGGTASISNMGMMGIKHFTAVINPPQSTILAVGAGEKRAWVMPDGTLGVADVMTATGSFDHRAVDGADGARLMAAFRDYVENPLRMVA